MYVQVDTATRVRSECCVPKSEFLIQIYEETSIFQICWK